MKSAAPTRASNVRTAWLIADGVTASSAAAVGVGARNFLRAGVAGRARLGFDDELLAKPRLHADGEEPHDGLGKTPGGVGNDHADRTIGITPGRACGERRKRSADQNVTPIYAQHDGILLVAWDPAIRL